jgi:hypothetical protein
LTASGCEKGLVVGCIGEGVTGLLSGLEKGLEAGWVAFGW